MNVMKKKAKDIKPLFYLYQIYKFIVIFPLFGISTTFSGLMGALTSFLFNERIGSKFGVFWGRFNSYITPISVEVSGKENIDINQSYVIISNHQSLFDILVMYGWISIDFRWVMKMELRNTPVLGFSCLKMGHIFVNRKDRESALASINEAKKKIHSGTSIIFFAEGTRSNDGKLLNFKKGAFRMAVDMGLPILPCTLVGTKEIVPNNTLSLFPGHVKLVIHEPIKIEGWTHDNLDKLIEKSKNIIQKGLDENS